MTHNDNRPGPGRNCGETVKNSFFQKGKDPKFAKRLVFILEKGTFLFAQLFPVVARTWLELRRMPQMENLENQPFFVVGLDVLWEPFSPPLVQSAMVFWFYGKQEEDSQRQGWLRTRYGTRLNAMPCRLLSCSWQVFRSQKRMGTSHPLKLGCAIDNPYLLLYV